MDQENPPIGVHELFEDFRVVSELADIPTGYVAIDWAEHSRPARMLVGRPRAHVWEWWGVCTRRRDKLQEHPLYALRPITGEDGVKAWRAADKYQTMAAILYPRATEVGVIPIPPGLEGWEQRHNARSELINWNPEDGE